MSYVPRFDEGVVNDAPPKARPHAKKVTISDLYRLRKEKQPITVLTAYDYNTGLACEEYGVDITLVGDSLAQVCLGYESTTQLTLGEMIHHCRAVARASKNPLLVADMPFGTTSSADIYHNAVRLIREGGVDAVKVEGGKDAAYAISLLKRAGIPVMGHIGLLPQRHTSLNGYRVQGLTPGSADMIVNDAKAISNAGAFALVIEAVPAALGTYISNIHGIPPTIGIGAGPGTHGQVLVWDDAMGVKRGTLPRFARRFANVHSEVEKGIMSYLSAVREGKFPLYEETYNMRQEHWEQFIRHMEGKEPNTNDVGEEDS
ncbi:ketopantoate hydroxymethyltransferase [Panus rudis PR-1116 ss-1]|nr:ketopantoate hydroxymethyltransferase [Panus rudis PR-1116 ss-1]